MVLSKLKKIIIGIATIVAIPSAYFAWKNDKIEHNSSGLSISLMNNRVNNNEERNIYICLSSAEDGLSGVSITPVFDNSTPYPLKDFDLRYQFESTEYIPEPNVLYDKISIDRYKCHFKYSEDRLAQYSQIHEPFNFADFPKKNSRYRVIAKASTPGAPYPYMYTINAWIRIVPRQKHQTFEDWRMTCKQEIYKINANKFLYDAYYLSRHEFKHEYGADFGISYATNSAHTPIEIASKGRPEVETQVKPEVQVQPVKQTAELEILSHKQIVENDIPYLQIVFNKPTLKDKVYHVVVYTKESGYSLYDIWGEQQSVSNIKLTRNEKDIAYVGLPILKDSLAQYIEFKNLEKNYLRIINTSKSPIIVELHYKKGGQYAFPLKRDGSTDIRNLTQDDIQSYSTYLIDRPKTFMEKLWDKLGWIAGLLCLMIGIGFFILFYREIQENKHNGKPIDSGGTYILLSLGVVFTIISITLIIDYFLHTLLTISIGCIILGSGLAFFSIESIKNGEYEEVVELILGILIGAFGIFLLLI